MKRFLLILLPFLFLACKHGYTYDLEVSNNSSFDVSFTINDDDTVYSVSSNNKIIVTSQEADKEVKLIDNPRVSMDKTFKCCIFTDMEYKDVTVYNTLALDIILCEDNGFIGQTFGETVSLSANSTKTFRLYTDNPKYSAYTIIDNKQAAVDISNLIFY